MINGVRKRDLTVQMRKTLGKEKPRGLTPVGVIVLLAAIQLLKVLHASNP